MRHGFSVYSSALIHGNRTPQWSTGYKRTEIECLGVQCRHILSCMSKMHDVPTWFSTQARRSSTEVWYSLLIDKRHLSTATYQQQQQQQQHAATWPSPLVPLTVTTQHASAGRHPDIPTSRQEVKNTGQCRWCISSHESAAMAASFKALISARHNE